MDQHFNFYSDILSELLKDGVITTESSLLVICGGPNDKNVLESLAFTNITFCNVDDRVEDVQTLYHPHTWKYEDAEQLSFRDNSFDLVVVHSGLHHLKNPLLGVTEMYRVAKTGILGFEPHNCFLTKICVKMGFGQQYETAAVFYNGFTHGGVNNTEIPNHVFRFSKDVILQTLRSYDPTTNINASFWYRTRLPNRLCNLKNKTYSYVIKLFGGMLRMFGKLPFLANNIAFFVKKPDTDVDLHPWLTMEDGNIRINKVYLQNEYTAPRKPTG